MIFRTEVAQPPAPAGAQPAVSLSAAVLSPLHNAIKNPSPECACPKKNSFHRSRLRSVLVKRNQKAVDRIFSRARKRREHVTLRALACALKDWLLSDGKEKIENLFHFRRVYHGVVNQAKLYGKGFLRFALISWLCDDFVVPAVFFALKWNALATFVLFGHFEPITYPSYFLISSLIGKSLAKKRRPCLSAAEQEALTKRIREALDEHGTYEGKQKAASEFVRRAGFSVIEVFRQDLLADYDPATASSQKKIGRREQAAKYLARRARAVGFSCPTGARLFERLKVMTKDPDPFVRRAVVAGFAKFGDKLDAGRAITACDLVAAHLSRRDEPEEMVRGAAARALGALPPSEKALRRLADVLNDPAEGFWVKRYAAQSIGAIAGEFRIYPHEPVEEYLLDILDLLFINASRSTQPSVEIRGAAVEALGRFPELAAACESHALLGKCIRDFLGQASMEDPDPTVREAALRAYAHRALAAGDPQIAELQDTLEGCLEGNDVNLAEISFKCLASLCHSRIHPVPWKAAQKINRLRKQDHEARPIRFVAVEDLYDTSAGERQRKSDSQKVHELSASLKAPGNAVCYVENFQRDRNTLPMAADGSLNESERYDVPALLEAIDNLSKGHVVRIPWIDMQRGRVAAARVILPNPDGTIFILGERKEVDQLAKIAGLPSSHILSPKEALAFCS